MSKYKFLLKKSPVDTRDILFTAPPVKSLISSIDLRTGNLMPPVLDQGNLGSCVANAASNALRYLLMKQKLPVFQPSRLYIYYNTRVFIEYTAPSIDSGCTIRGICKSINKYYACDEKWCPYKIETFNKPPPLTAYKNANLHKGVKYLYVKQDLNNIKLTLANKYPIILGISVYDSLVSDSVLQTGDIPLPDTSKENLLGAHAVLLCGYDDNTQKFLLQNSWGTSVGKNGYFTIPYSYITNPNLASDLWTFNFFN